MIDIAIKIENAGWPEEMHLRNQLAHSLEYVFNALGLIDVHTELSVLFTDDQTMQEINLRWRGKDAPTNVLSFPAFVLKAGQSPRPLMGDIVFALEIITREAYEQQKTFHNHLTHLMVHGILHLLGFDHQNAAEAEVMEALERKILDEFAIPDPYSQ